MSSTTVPGEHVLRAALGQRARERDLARAHGEVHRPGPARRLDRARALRRPDRPLPRHSAACPGRPMNRLVPISSATNGERGWRSSSSREPACATRPSSSTTIWSPNTSASTGLWVTYTVTHGRRCEQASKLHPHRPAGLEVERGERLVEQQQPRAQHQRAGERGALLLPARELVRHPAGELRDAYQSERLVHHLPDPTRGRAAGAEAERDVLVDREMGEQRVVLRHVADVPLPGRHVEAVAGVGVRARRPGVTLPSSSRSRPASSRSTEVLPAPLSPTTHRRAAGRRLEGDVQRERVPLLNEARVEHGRRARRGARG